MAKGKLLENLKKAIGEPKWVAISSYTAVAAVAAVAAVSLIPDIVLAKRS